MNLTNITTSYFNGLSESEQQDARSVLLGIEACSVHFDIEIPLHCELKLVARKLRLLANEIEKECEN